MEIEQAATDTDRRFLEKLFRANVADLRPRCVPSLDLERARQAEFGGLHTNALLLIRGKGRQIAAGINSHSPVMFARLADPSSASKILEDWRLLEHLAVDPPFRLIGMARALISAAADQHSIEGAKHWLLQVDDKDKGSVAFYHRIGFLTLAGPQHIPNKVMASLAAKNSLARSGTWMYKDFA